MKIYDTGRIYDSANGDVFPSSFPAPVQVLFYETPEMTDNQRWIGGIAYQDYVICGECGEVVKINTLDKLFVFNSWINISEEIGTVSNIGDEAYFLKISLDEED